MPLRLTVLVISLLLGAAAQLPAQRLESPPFSFPSHGLDLQRMRWTAVATVQNDDHLLEGAAIGAAVGGLAAVAVRSSSCKAAAPGTPKHSCFWRTIGWTVLGMATGAVAGGLVAATIDNN